MYLTIIGSQKISDANIYNRIYLHFSKVSYIIPDFEIACVIL